ncbi:integrase catalytic domain-containing protein [Burkholderia lata]|uniref:integrase catalytic domain-containing protein n=1 Tax=Burkholderia lata (strain ATCC 17760 / DSM 23089 / LMG 22485 / NCIMB 9086 / R18194 / 383) TaxID=482957 RepID=UPI003F5AE60F
MDALANGRRLKCSTIVEDFRKEAVDIAVAYGISRLYLARALDRAASFRRYPKVLHTYQGPEFMSRVLAKCCFATSAH